MTTRYVIDEVGCWTGETVEWSERQPIPERTILEPPPSLEPGEFALWLGAWTVVAEKPEPPEPEPAPPHFPPLSRREVKHILVEIGIAPETVEAKINEKYDAAIEEAEAIEDEGARLAEIAAIEKERKHDLIDWQDAQYFERSYPLLNDLADLFDLPPEQVDALWLWGAEQ